MLGGASDWSGARGEVTDAAIEILLLRRGIKDGDVAVDEGEEGGRLVGGRGIGAVQVATVFRKGTAAAAEGQGGGGKGNSTGRGGGQVLERTGRKGGDKPRKRWEGGSNCEGGKPEGKEQEQRRGG